MKSYNSLRSDSSLKPGTGFVVFISIVLFLFLQISSSSAQTLQNLPGDVEQGVCVELTQGCNCTFNNITKIIYQPNSTQILGEVEMQKIGQEFNYTFCGTSLLGIHTVYGLGDPDGELLSWRYTFTVTQSGFDLTVADSILYIALIVLFISGSVFFLVVGFNTHYDDKTNPKGTITRLIPAKYIKVFCIWVGYGLFLLFFQLTTGIVNSFVKISLVYLVMSNIYVGLNVLFYPLTIIVMTTFLVEFYKDLLIPLFKTILSKWFKKK